MPTKEEFAAASAASYAAARAPEPTQAGISAEERFRKLQDQARKAESARRSELWYGKKDSKAEQPDAPKKEGILASGITLLQAPMRAGLGAVKYVAGKSPDQGLGESMYREAFKRKEGYGNLLRDFGTPETLAMPLGIAADIMFDPVNWLTAGGAALVPRLAKTGAAVATGKAAASAVPQALKSYGLGKAATIASWTPVLRKAEAVTGAADDAGKAVREGLYGKAAKASEEYAQTMGIADDFAKPPVWKGSSLEQISANLEAKYPRMKGLSDFLVAKPDKGYEARRIADAEKAGDMLSALEDVKDAEKSILSKGRTAFDGYDAGKATEDLAAYDRAGVRIAPGKAEYSQAGRDEILRSLEHDGWDPKWIERANRALHAGPKIHGRSIGEWSLAVSDGLNDLLRTAKVFMGGSAYVGQVVGNMGFTMAKGIDVARRDMWTAMTAGAAMTFRNGKSWDFAREYLIGNGRVIDWMEANPAAFAEIAGITPDEFFRHVAGDVIRKTGSVTEVQGMRDFGQISEKVAELMSVSPQKFRTLSKSQADVEAFKLALAEGTAKLPSPYDVTDWRKLAKQQGLTKEEIVRMMEDQAERLSKVPSFVGQELSRPGGATQARRWLAQKAVTADSSVVKELAGAALKVHDLPASVFGKMDTMYRTGLFGHLVGNGLTAEELRLVARSTPLGKADIVDFVWRNGKKAYRLDPDKAAQIVNDVYMDYRSLPGWAKIVRRLPFVGSPLISFPAIMATQKIPNTLMSNPAFFSKTGAVLTELGGQPTAKEKEIIAKSPYYRQLQETGQLRLGMIPFFRDSPVYLRIANMFPFLRLDMFEPSDRSYGDGAVGKLFNSLDPLLMNSPVGQFLKDYVLVPTLMDTQMAQGAVGQQLWPQSVDPFTKEWIPYAAKGAVEPFMPTIPMAAAGAAVGSVAPGALDYVPSSSAAKMGYAMQGLNPKGIGSGDDRIYKSVKAIAALLGVTVTDVNLDTKIK